MNTKQKFLELVLSDFLSKRDSLEMDFNMVLNDETMRVEKKKKQVINIISEMNEINGKIEILSGFLLQVLPNNEDENNNN
jgi:hypothetical protein